MDDFVNPCASADKAVLPEEQRRQDSREEGQVDGGSNSEEKLEGASESFNEEVPAVEKVPEDGTDPTIEPTNPPSPADMPSGLEEVNPAPVVVVKETEPYLSTEDTHSPVVHSQITICVRETTHIHPTTEANTDLPRAGSVSSLGSVYSTLPEKGDYSITGEVLIGMEYQSGQLLVHVVGARGLAAANKGGSSDPYAQIYLLPDKKRETKKKTKVVKKTCNPNFYERFKYEVSDSSLLGRTLWLSVWSRDLFGSNQFLGEALVALKTYDLSTYTKRWYLLKDKDLPRAGSVSSLGSVYSTLPEKGDYSITGEVLIGMEYQSGQLLVHVVGARGLAAADKGGSSDPYAQTYLLPDKKKETKKKTKVVKKTCNPNFYERFKYEVSDSSLLSRTLWLSVWSRDLFGSNQFLGEALVPLKKYNLSTYTERWYLLKDKDLPRAGSVSSLGSVYSTLPEKGDYSITGEVLIGMEYQSGQLLVHVVGARGLAAADKGGSSDPYAQTYLLPDKKKETKKKTKVVKKTCNPNFYERFKYEVSDSSLLSRTLWLSVWSRDLFGSNQFLGEALVPLKKYNLSTYTERWYLLKDKDLPRAESVSSLGSVYSTLPEKGDYSITGEVLFGLEYHSGQLLVHVVAARGLAAADKGGSSDPYVKTYLLPDKKKESKKKTKAVKKTRNPNFDETLKYKVPNSGLEKRTLCLSVWNDNFWRSKFLGQIKVPLSKVDLSQRRDRWMTLTDYHHK